MMKRPCCIVLTAVLALAATSAYPQEIDARAHRSIVETLQHHIEDHPSVFPLEALEGGVQSYVDGLRIPYYGYGERRYTTRTDFHPAFDVGYFPEETGNVNAVNGQAVRVRSPQSYLKKIHAIQEGLLFAVERKSTGYKIILEHTLEEPYYDSKGRAYDKYYTCYRHVDARSLIYLTLLAREVLDDAELTYEDIVGRYVFEAGEVIAFVGFDPNTRTTTPRSHLDFSLNPYPNPDSGKSIRKYSLNPLLLFPPFGYGDPYTHQREENGIPVYQFVIDPETIDVPTKRHDGALEIEIHSGGVGPDGAFQPVRYFALNALEISVFNGGEQLGAYTVNRHLKLGYDTSSYEALDEYDASVPHFSAPLGEQGDVYRMGAVLPARWLKTMNYDWSKPGSISIRVSSIWDGYLDGHSAMVEIPLPAK
jgi:hypothetical protein